MWELIDVIWLLDGRGSCGHVAAVTQHGLVVVLVGGRQGAQVDVQAVTEQRSCKFVLALRSAGRRLKPGIIEATGPTAVGSNDEQPRPLLKETAAFAVDEGDYLLNAKVAVSFRSGRGCSSLLPT